MKTSRTRFEPNKPDSEDDMHAKERQTLEAYALLASRIVGGA